jgi:Meckel syndrome type 1 protein
VLRHRGRYGVSPETPVRNRILHFLVGIMMIKPALLLAGALFLSAQHALAGDASGTDADPPLPLRVVITYPTSASHPRFQASFSAWTLAPIFAAASRQAAAGARSANQTARQSEVSATSAANQAQRQSAVSENQQRRQAVSSANEAQRQQASHENVETRQAGAALRVCENFLEMLLV